MTKELPNHWFERVDSGPDEAFYAQPRMVAHIDQATIDALTDFYREFLPTGADVLDLMSSWISHFPQDLQLGRVSGLGMNSEELAANSQLTEGVVHNLNTDPNLPYDRHQFDRMTLAVSIQYLTSPVEVMRSALEKLKPGGRICIAMSHRLFPTKAIAAFQQMSVEDRVRLVMLFLEEGGFSEVEYIDRSPPNADPLWLIVGTAS